MRLQLLVVELFDQGRHSLDCLHGACDLELLLLQVAIALVIELLCPWHNLLVNTRNAALRVLELHVP